MIDKSGKGNGPPGEPSMDDDNGLGGLSTAVREAFVLSAPYLSDHPGMLRLLHAAGDLSIIELSAHLKERVGDAGPLRKTDIRIFLSALERIEGR